MSQKPLSKILVCLNFSEKTDRLKQILTKTITLFPEAQIEIFSTQEDPSVYVFEMKTNQRIMEDKIIKSFNERFDKLMKELNFEDKNLNLHCAVGEFKNELKHFLKNNKTNYDLIVLGKKQGYFDNVFSNSFLINANVKENILFLN